MDFSAIASAGLTQAEFAKLVGVSRVTVNTWVRGKMHPHHFISDKVDAALARLRKATRAGTLPLRGTRRSDRLALISAVVLAC